TTLGTDTDNAEEQALIQKYIEGTKIKGPQKSNMAFQLEKMPYAYRPLDYDFIMQINHQKAVIFSENGLELSSDPQYDDDGIMLLPKSSVKLNCRIFKIFKTIKNIKDFDWCEKHCNELMPKHEKEIARIKQLDFSKMTIGECGGFIKHAFQLTAEISYDRFMYAVFPGVVGGGLSKVIKKVNPKYTTYDFYWGLDNKTSVVANDVAALAKNLRKIDGAKEAICSGKNYEEICRAFPSAASLFNEFLEKNGYKSDFNCYCIIARTLLEQPDRLLNILRPLLANEESADSENTKDFSVLMNQIKAIYGSDFPSLEKKINQFRYFHVVREETQYLWETLFCILRRCLERANELLLGNSDYEHGIANLFYEELAAACERGKLSESDKEKISRRNSKHPLAEKVWAASKFLVFDSDGETLKGISGSSGVAVGPARIIRSPSEFYKMQKGDVLVCELTDPEWTPLFKLASAVVADTGAALSHAAIVAREFGLPAVLGTGFATQRFSDGQNIRVDGNKGEVCAV
ncbi:MAG: phosphoenolpyruvate synthase, partial [Spirochaetaceae bacterium]|nr:phosphoenolpyruvate synthase [Spirochaetaceae bacterium]